MRTTCYNEEQLDKVLENAYGLLKNKGAVNIIVEEYHKPTTIKQLGFFFGCIASAITDFLNKEEGENSWSIDAVKDIMRTWLAPKVRMIKKNGDVYEHSLHISEMDRQQMCEFIDKSLIAVEKAPSLKGLILHPSVRFCWVHNITKEDLRNLNREGLQRKCPEYLNYVRGQCCLCCGRFGCEAHHIRETEVAGVARKADDWETIPLCNTCHRHYHIKGKEWFNEQIHWILKYMTLEEFCNINYNRWKNHF